jgi:hypothetical protein
MTDLTIATKQKMSDITLCQEQKNKSRQASALANSLIVQHRISEALPLWQILKQPISVCNAVALRDWVLAHQSFDSVDECFEISRELLMNIDQFMDSGI